MRGPRSEGRAWSETEEGRKGLNPQTKGIGKLEDGVKEKCQGADEGRLKEEAARVESWVRAII